MPTYDYRCQDCEHTFEKFQGIKDPVLTQCPVCQGRIKRLIGAGAGLIFKGSGFYITDYRSKDYQQKAKADGGKSEGGSSGGETSTSKNKENKADGATKPSSPAAKDA